MLPSFITRVRLISAVIFLLALFLVARLFFIQVVRGHAYAEKADHQNQSTLAENPDRGSIFFQEKDGQLVSAATMQDGFLLALNPKILTEADVAYTALSQIIPLDHDSFIKKATKPDDPYEEIATKLDDPTATKIKNLNLVGVNVYKNRWRFYPAKESAAATIGLVNQGGTGTYGLEKYYDQLLRRDPSQSFITFLSETLSELGGSVLGQNNTHEGDLILSLEPVVQKTLETELTNVSEVRTADSAGGIIIDPKTGEVVAMASLPSFDPGARQASVDFLGNPLIERVFEMGSIMKPLTMAAALDAGALTASTTYNDKGYVELNGRRIENYDGKGRGVVSMQTVLNQSLNTGAVFAMQQLGRDSFQRYMLAYGLGEKTGIDLPAEISGLVKNLQSGRDVEAATAAFGQGIAVTPLEMTRALATLANGGILIQPHVVKEIERQNTKLSTTVKTGVGTRVLKPETSHEITRMLVEVVDKALAGGKAKLTNYTVAAKTGTAQIANPAGGGYYADRFLHSFFGYFPAYQPRFLVFLYLVNPHGVTYASETLTQPFINLTKYLLNYYNIAPDR